MTVLAILLLLIEPSISLSTRVTVCTEPCSVTAYVRIENWPVGAEVCFALYDGFDEPYRRSCQPYTGRRITDVTIKEIPAGQYVMLATLGLDGRRSNQISLRVLSRLGAGD